MYEIAAHHRVWNVEQEGGLKYQMDYNQFWAWVEFNRLATFTPEREDWRNAKLLSKLHNVNTTKESHLTTPNDFMPRTIDQIIEDEIAKEQKGDHVDAKSEILSFNQHVAHLKSIGRPVKTIKV